MQVRLPWLDDEESKQHTFFELVGYLDVDPVQVNIKTMDLTDVFYITYTTELNDVPTTLNDIRYSISTTLDTIMLSATITFNIIRKPRYITVDSYYANIFAGNIMSERYTLLPLTKKEILKDGLSLFIRSRNEVDTIIPCLQSVIDLVDEIIYVDNNSSDGSLELVQTYQTYTTQKYPDRLKVYSYNVVIPRVGRQQSEALKSNEFKSHETNALKSHEMNEFKSDLESNHESNSEPYSPRNITESKNGLVTLGNYYNFCLRRVTCKNVLKYDADMIANRINFKQMIEKHRLRTRTDSFALWCTGETVFINNDGNTQWLKKKSFYDEYRAFSLYHNFRYRDNKNWEGPSYEYFQNTIQERFELPFFYELRSLPTIMKRVIVDDRDRMDNHIANDLISTNRSDQVTLLSTPITYHRNHLGRLLYITPHLGIGGAEHVLISHVTALSHLFIVDVVTTTPSIKPSHLFHYAKGRINVLNSMNLMEEIIERNKKQRYQVVIFNNTEMKDMARINDLREMGTKIVWISHSDVAWFNSVILSSVIPKDVVWAVNHKIINKLRHKQLDIQYIPNAVSIVDHHPNAAHSVAHNKAKYDAMENMSNQDILQKQEKKQMLKMAFIGRLELPKIPELIIAALYQHRSSWSLDVIGDGPRLADIKQFEKNERGKSISRVKFLGAIQNSIVSKMLPSYDVLILPSSHEGLPIVLLEAMAHGVLVVASNVGGINELIQNGKNGLLFDLVNLNELADQHFSVPDYNQFHQLVLKHWKQNIQALVSCLERLQDVLQDDEWRSQMIQSALETVSNGYSYQVQKKCLTKAVLEFLNEK